MAFLLNYLDDIVHVDHAFDSSLRIDDRHHQQVMAHEEAGSALPDPNLRRGNNLRAHDITDMFFASWSRSGRGKETTPSDVLLRVQDIDVVDRFSPACALSREVAMASSTVISARNRE